MRSVLQERADFLFVSSVRKDLENRAEEPKKKIVRTDKSGEKSVFEKLLDVQIKSLA